ncbi:MAG: hypothetical protein C4542_05400 [Dehalococcoidia bacterium]|nr:MAG: hypothetical protein C4542_05400 [Dehalococcoidia bacterium]
MTGKWKKAYAELVGYIAGNPEIKISRSVTIIPGEAREEFYRLFDDARRAFIEEQTPAIYEEACRLSKGYLAEVGALKEILKVAEIKAPPRLDGLLNDPVNGISRALFDPLFDFLKTGGVSEEFECKAAETVKAYWQPLYKRGYEDWVILSLANMLSLERILASSWDEIVRECHELQPDQKRGWTEQNVPEPEELEKIELGHEGYDPAFIISDIILRSQKLKRYVSFGADLTDAAWYAKNASDKREWIKLRDRGLDSKPLLNWPGFVIYTDSEPVEISLVADFSRFLRPEIMVECMVQEDWYQRGYLDKIKTRHEFFKPTLGTFIVSRYPVPDEAFKALETKVASQKAAEARAETGLKIAPEVAPGEKSTAGVEPQEKTLNGTEAALQVEAGKSTRSIFIISAAGYDRESLAPIIEVLKPPVEEEDREAKQ